MKDFGKESSRTRNRSRSSALRDHASDASNEGAMSYLPRRENAHAGQQMNTDGLAGPWSVLTSEPIIGVAVYADAGYLLIDLQSTSRNIRMQFMRRDLPVVLKTLNDAVGQLAAVLQ